MKDLAGNAMAADFVVTWTTGASSDAGPPTVLGTTVPDGAVNVSIDTRLAATFSEGMDPLTVTNVNCTVTETLSGELALAVTVSYSGVTLEFVLDRFAPMPHYLLFPNTTYTVTLKGGVGGVEDLAGNPMANDYAWTFTTGPPI